MFTLLCDLIKQTRKAFTGGRANHSVAGVTYLQFPIQIRVFPPHCRNWFPSFTLSVSAEKERFPPVTLNFGLWPPQMNLILLGSRWTVTSNVKVKGHFVRQLSCEHTQHVDCITWTARWSL